MWWCRRWQRLNGKKLKSKYTLKWIWTKVTICATEVRTHSLCRWQNNHWLLPTEFSNAKLEWMLHDFLYPFFTCSRGFETNGSLLVCMAMDPFVLRTMKIVAIFRLVLVSVNELWKRHMKQQPTFQQTEFFNACAQLLKQFRSDFQIGNFQWVWLCRKIVIENSVVVFIYCASAFLLLWIVESGLNEWIPWSFQQMHKQSELE